MEAKKQAQTYLEKLLNLKDQERTEVYDRHAREVDSLREKSNKDIELAKQALTDLYEKKVEYLSEAKDEA